ncbi:MAG TPA: universal stress protein [Ktedonobacterales bacterium]
MFKKVLIPLDGSERSEQAIIPAARIARAHGAGVLLLQIVQMPVVYGPYGAGVPGALDESIENERNLAREYMAKLAQSTPLQGLHVETLAPIGLPAPSIIDAASSQHADLIVIASHGRTGMGRWLLGSVAQQVARNAASPVLIIRTNGKTRGATSPVDHVTRALVGLDGSSRAEQALEPAVDVLMGLAAPGKGALHLTQVISWLPDSPLGNRKELAIETSRDYLTAVAQRVSSEREKDLASHATWSVVVDHDPAASLIRTAEAGESAEGAGPAEACDLIVVATHGYSGLMRWAMGSVAERVLSHTTLPILIVRVRDGAE